MQLIISRLQYFSSLEKRVLFFTFRYFWRLDTFVLDISIPFCVFGYFWHLDTLFWHFDTWFLTFGSFDIWIRFFWHFDTFGPYRNVLVSRCNCIEMSMYRNVSLPSGSTNFEDKIRKGYKSNLSKLLQLFYSPN